MPKLYGTWRSRASRPLWLALEVGLDLKLIPIWQAYRLQDPHAPGAPTNTLSPEFLAISPLGATPVLDDKGLILTESLAITLHLARRYGGSLGPQGDAELALMEQWSLFGATWIEEAALSILNIHGAGQAESPEGRATIATRLDQLSRPFTALSDHLAQRGHAVGGRFTVADINLAEVIRYATAAPGALDPWPVLRDWLAACHARPAFREMWARREAEPLRWPQ